LEYVKITQIAKTLAAFTYIHALLILGHYRLSFTKGNCGKEEFHLFTFYRTINIIFMTVLLIQSLFNVLPDACTVN